MQKTQPTKGKQGLVLKTSHNVANSFQHQSAIADEEFPELRQRPVEYVQKFRRVQ